MPEGVIGRLRRTSRAQGLIGRGGWRATAICKSATGGTEIATQFMLCTVAISLIPRPLLALFLHSTH
jgi:hypothetical protein